MREWARGLQLSEGELISSNEKELHEWVKGLVFRLSNETGEDTELMLSDSEEKGPDVSCGDVVGVDVPDVMEELAVMQTELVACDAEECDSDDEMANADTKRLHSMKIPNDISLV